MGQSMARALRATRRRCTVHIEGDSPVLAPPGVVAAWHEDIVPFLVAHADDPALQSQTWLNHPLWFMRSVHVMLFELGIGELVLGSSGHGGQRAAEVVAGRLGQGRSTVCWLDGPAGPRFQPKRGAALLAARAQVPLVPMRIHLSSSWTAERTWDKKRLPRPGSTVTVRFGRPVEVGPGDDDILQATAAVAAALGELADGAKRG